MSESQFRYIVRLFGQDVDGTMKAPYGLAMVKGIGYNTARIILMKLNIDKDKRLGELTDHELKKIEEILANKRIESMPAWIFNRRKDIESGQDLHYVTSDLVFVVRNDIEREKKLKSWRGVRHSLGLKVRGQRTRTTGRTGTTIGVKRSKAAQPSGGQQSQQQQKK